MSHVPPSRTSAEACLTGWPNARPQGWDKCSVARHHQACLMVRMLSVDAAVYKDYGRERGVELERPCATIFNLLGFITTASLTATTHCMTDGLTLACLEP